MEKKQRQETDYIKHSRSKMGSDSKEKIWSDLNQTPKKKWTDK